MATTKLNGAMDFRTKNCLKSETCAKARKVIEPPNDVILRGALLPSYVENKSEFLHSVDDPEYEGDDQVLLSADEFRQIERNRLMQRLSRDMTTNLTIHVQHGTNKIRNNLLLTSTDVSIFVEYFRKYSDPVHSSRSIVVDGAPVKHPCIEFSFKAPLFPPFDNKYWPTKLHGSIVYDDVTGTCSIETDSDTSFNKWQHFVTGVKRVTFRIDTITRLVTCDLKLVTYRFFEPEGIVGMSHLKCGWIKAL
jgi:hypothetical protein